MPGPRTKRRRIWKRVEYCFWTIGFAALGYWTFVWVNARVTQAAANQQLERRLQTNLASNPRPQPAYGSLIGRLDIPGIQLSAVVFEGTDTRVLQSGVGHLAGSSLPGEAGNVVLAGHRDTFFRALRNIRQRELVTLTTDHGTRRYLVESTAVISPDATSVLDATPTSSLTLITCYPFHYFGHAPKRFAVRCREIQEEPQAVAAARTPSPPARPAAKPHRTKIAAHRKASRVPMQPVQPAAVALETSGSEPHQSTPAAEPAQANDEFTPEPPHEETAKSPAKVHSARGLQKLNPVRLFGKLARAVRRPERPELSGGQAREKRLE